MSTYVPVELKQHIRSHFKSCCAYCQTAEALTVAIFEFERVQWQNMTNRLEPMN